MGRVIELAFRITNGVRKVAAGLRPFNESVWPGVRTDVFVAHESLYRFFGSHAAGRDVLDAGCGTGYGSHLLALAGARSVVGIDIDRFSVGYARRHYGARIRFDVGDIERLPYGDAAFDLVIASNSLEHLNDPGAFLSGVRRALRPGGKAILAIPPIHSQADFDVHRGIHYHRNQLHITEWIALLTSLGFELRYDLHELSAPGIEVNFHSHRPSRLTAESFKIVPVSKDIFMTSHTITAIYEATP